MAVKHFTQGFYDLNPLFDTLEELCAIKEDMTVPQALMFLLIATKPGITQVEIIDNLGFTTAFASRTYAILAERGNRGTEPLHLVTTVPDNTDYRIKRLYLTPKGANLCALLTNKLKGNNGSKT